MKKEGKKIAVSVVFLVLMTLFGASFMQAAPLSPDGERIIEKFRRSPGVNGDNSSFYVVDLQSGETLASLNRNLPLIPASIMKSVTTATLLSSLPEDYRYETRVYITGKVENGELDGDIMVIGSGDPSLNSRFLDANSDICGEIVEFLQREGIRVVRGGIKVDEDIWSGPAVAPSWQSGDLVHAYGTGSHGLNFEDNASCSRSVSNPANVFRSRLQAALSKAGIEMDNKHCESKTRRLLMTHYSVPLDEIMRSCMMRSDNQYAEAMLRTYEVSHGGKGATANAARREMEYWRKEKAPMEGVTIVDGSGLSRSNRVTANFMVHVLKARADNPYYASFFPLAGQEGTLKNFLAGTPLEGYIAMKTGSMNGIQCYAGYKLDEDYAPTHIIVVIMNEMGNRATAREAVKDALLEIFVPDQPHE